MNVYPSNDGYIFRILNIHVEYFKNKTNQSLKIAIDSRNQYYLELKFLPESIFIRHISEGMFNIKNKSGYVGIYESIEPRRKDMARVVCVKLHSFFTRKQTNKRFILDGNSFEKSEALKDALKLRSENIYQINLITHEYNRLKFAQVMPYAIQEQKTLVPTLYKFNYFDLETWLTAGKNVFPRGFLNSYTLRN